MTAEPTRKSPSRVVPTQAEALAWVAARWPKYVTVEWRAMKVGEEAGEVLGAVIKASLGLKPRSEIGVEAAQTYMCLLALAEAEGFDLDDALAAEWEVCATRAWPSQNGQGPSAGERFLDEIFTPPCRGCQGEYDYADNAHTRVKGCQFAPSQNEHSGTET